MKQRILLITALLSGALFSQGQTPSIIPKPLSVENLKGNGIITSRAQIQGRPEVKKSAQFLVEYLHKMYGFTPMLTGSKKQKGETQIELVIEPKNNVIAGEYSLSVKNKHIKIVGADEEGVFYGVQTLIQMLPFERSSQLVLPCVNIKDAPRFAYRGLNIDVCRHFFDVDFIKKYIDLMALYKINTFHWHLTDDQGWR
ncbi:MAG TPA: glycoside hydrolase family 20 zincin-like fold domain-containing protein, partial [Chitinophagaceae bacterium]